MIDLISIIGIIAGIVILVVALCFDPLSIKIPDRHDDSNDYPL